MRKDNGVLHFYVNGVDQGQAATNVPAEIYGVIDLYGQAAEATIVAQEGETWELVVNNWSSSSISAAFLVPNFAFFLCLDLANLQPVESQVSLSMLDTNTSDRLRFHPRHGRNAVVSPDGRSASRPNARGEFNDAIVVTSRPLKDNELFEVSLDKMVDRWSGSIEAGALADYMFSCMVQCNRPGIYR